MLSDHVVLCRSTRYMHIHALIACRRFKCMYGVELFQVQARQLSAVCSRMMYCWIEIIYSFLSLSLCPTSTEFERKQDWTASTLT